MLFKDEVRNTEELVVKLNELNLTNKDIKICVAGFVFDKEGRLLLHRRGPGARDEIGKLQALGGSINKNDQNFREALIRELKEEGGENNTLEITSFIGALEDSKVDTHTNVYTSWIILAYKVNLLDGVIINNEPERTVAIESAYINEFKKDEMSWTCQSFVEELERMN